MNLTELDFISINCYATPEKSIKTDITSLLYSKHIPNLLDFTGDNKREAFPIDLFYTW